MKLHLLNQSIHKCLAGSLFNPKKKGSSKEGKLKEFNVLSSSWKKIQDGTVVNLLLKVTWFLVIRELPVGVRDEMKGIDASTWENREDGVKARSSSKRVRATFCNAWAVTLIFFDERRRRGVQSNPFRFKKRGMRDEKN